MQVRWSTPDLHGAHRPPSRTGRGSSAPPQALIPAVAGIRLDPAGPDDGLRARSAIVQCFWTTAELRARGKSARQTAAAAADGRLLAVRTGVWARPGTPTALVRAVRVGGVATAHTAARSRGLWVPPDPRPSAFRRGDPAPPPVLRVAVPLTTSLARLHDPDDPSAPLGGREDVVLAWTAAVEVRAARGAGAVSVLAMLRDVFRAEPPERALAVVDSALHHRYIRLADLDALAALLPARLAPVLRRADPRAQSGTETIARYLLQLAGLTVEPQAEIARVGCVDLLVEGRVIVEVDGREWHDGDAFEEDRLRDLLATTDRYRVLRFSWYQVLFRWPEVEAAVFAALAA